MKKVCVYLDETGKKEGEHFIVCLVALDSNEVGHIQDILTTIESSTKKHSKWAKSNYNVKSVYISQIIETPDLYGAVYAVVFPSLNSEIQQKCIAIGTALNQAGRIDGDTKIHVFIDGELSREEKNTYRQLLKKEGIKPYKITAVRKRQDNPIINLSDSICGLTRNYYKKDDDIAKLYKKAVRSGLIIPIERKKTTD